MPSSLTIVSPVSGETIPTGSVVTASVDYDHVYAYSAYIGGYCTTNFGHSGYAGPIAGSKSDSAEVDLGTHSTASSGVELTARIQDTSSWNSPFVAQGSVNNITISDDPPVVVNPPAVPVPVAPTPTPYYRVGEGGLDASQMANFFLDEFGNWVAYDATAHSPKKDHIFDKTKPLDLTLTIPDAGHRANGWLMVYVYGRENKTDLKPVAFLHEKVVVVDAAKGWCRLTIPTTVLGKAKVPRLAVVSLLDAKDGELVSVTSATLKAKKK